MTKVFSIAVLTVVLLISCNRETRKLASSNSPVLETTSSDQSNTLIKEQGWEIPGLKTSKVIKDDKSNNNSPFRVKRYVRDKSTVIESSFFTDSEREVLKILKGELVINSIYGYEFEERSYCYMLLVHPPGIGSLSRLRFYDKDGDGKFESVDNGDKKASFEPFTPNWVK